MDDEKEGTPAYRRSAGIGPKSVKAGRTVMHPKERTTAHCAQHPHQRTAGHEEKAGA